MVIQFFDARNEPANNKNKSGYLSENVHFGLMVYYKVERNCPQ